jgi:hypothetical protein
MSNANWHSNVNGQCSSKCQMCQLSPHEMNLNARDLTSIELDFV